MTTVLRSRAGIGYAGPMQTDAPAHLDDMLADLAILAGDPNADPNPAGEFLRDFLLRSDQAAGAVAAIAARADKVAKRVPGLVVTPHVRPYQPHGRDPLYCTRHRRFHCDALAYDPAAFCHKLAMPAVTVEIWADGLPIASGWTVAGVLTEDAAGVLTTTTIGDADERDVLASRPLAGQCQHCNKSRRRTTTVLLRNVDTLAIVPVGKSCLAEYTGTALTPDLLKAVLNFGADVEDDMEEMGGSATDVAPTVEIVALARALTTRYGFLRSVESGSTRDRMVRVLIGAKDADDYRDLVTADTMTAARADMDLIAASTDQSEYITNLQAVAGADWTVYAGRHNRVGLLASLPQAADRMRSDQVKRDTEAAGRVDAHIGAEKQRREFTGTVRTNMLIETAYGFSTRFTVDTAEGTVTAFGKIAGADDVEIGATVTFVATIKAHSQFRGERQTEVNRVKLAG